MRKGGRNFIYYYLICDYMFIYVAPFSFMNENTSNCIISLFWFLFLSTMEWYMLFIRKQAAQPNLFPGSAWVIHACIYHLPIGIGVWLVLVCCQCDGHLNSKNLSVLISCFSSLQILCFLCIYLTPSMGKMVSTVWLVFKGFVLFRSIETGDGKWNLSRCYGVK